MFNSKMYALLALALGVAVAAPAQAGNTWNAPSITGTAREQPTVAAAPARESGYEAYARARKRRLPNADISTPARSHHPGMTGHTLHHPGH
jgi:hypothetical protein